MKYLFLILSFLFVLNADAQTNTNRISLRKGLQKCLDLIGNPIQNCFTTTNADGEMIYIDSVAMASMFGDSDWLAINTLIIPGTDDTIFHKGKVIIGNDSVVKSGTGTLQIESISPIGGSALDVYVNGDYRHGARFYNTVIDNDNPTTFINGVGAYYSRMWMVISAAESGSGAGYTLVHPTNEPFMLGIMGDIPGACAALRQAGTAGAYNIQGMDSDGNTTFKLEGDGTLQWGIDSTHEVDTYLTRNDSASLLTGGEFHIGNATAVGDGKLNVVGRIDQRYPTTTQHNIAIGENNSIGITSGDFNVSIGYNNANGTTTGSGNIAIGNNVLQANTVGTSNIAIGEDALYSNTASNNVAMGLWALRSNVTGTNNIALGWKSLSANTVSNNIAIGNSALQLNTTGDKNYAIGVGALSSNLTGANNVAIGYQARANTSSSNDVAIGVAALVTGSDGENVAIGTEAGNTASGIWGTLVGRGAGSNVSGNKNTTIGAYSGIGMTGGGVAIGFGAGYNNTESNKLFIHNEAGSSLANDKLISIIYGEMNATTSSQVLHLNAKVKATYGLNIPTGTPASATAAGTAGDILWDSNYIYICIATNTWQRMPHATW